MSVKNCLRQKTVSDKKLSQTKKKMKMLFFIKITPRIDGYFVVFRQIAKQKYLNFIIRFLCRLEEKNIIFNSGFLNSS